MNQLVPVDLRVKYTPENKEAMKKRRAEGVSFMRIAEEFGVPYSSVRLILSPAFRKTKTEWNRKNWKRYYSTQKANEIKRKYRTRKRD